MNAPREPKQGAGAVFHTGTGYHSYPPPKDRSPRRRVCPSCQLPADTNARTCPVCGARYEPPLHKRVFRKFGRA